MKTLDYLSKFKDARREVRYMAHKIMICRMVADSIRDIVPVDYKIEPVNYSYGVKISPVDETFSLDHFPKFAQKLAKVFRNKPDIEINTEHAVATWWVYPAMGDMFIGENQIRIELVFGNTEKCDIIKKPMVYESYELTGYCKKIKEMEYDIS
jgi:hypothetical protein